MVRKLVELPKFLVSNSTTNSFGNSSVFTFYLLLFTLYRVLYLLLGFGYGVSDIFVFAFQMELNNYPHFDHGECHTRFLRPKPDAHRMYAQDQVVIHTVRM
jgi:hypothetical protein